MIRISALNDTVSDGEGKGHSQGRGTTKEAKEAEAFALYNKALGLQRQGEVTRAETMFKELLHHPFMQEAVRLVNEEEEDTVHPGLQVLYSTHKNMATIALQRADTTAAIESLLEAVVVDATEVTVWYKIGTLALKLCKYSLARFSFEQGLQCNPRHWPCLDNVITVLYVLNDYWHCLSYIAQALERDSGYTKGLAIRRQIFKEHAALKKDTEYFFKLCDPAIFRTEVDQTEADEFINEALEMRQKRRELAKVVKPPPVKLPTLANYTWRSLGRSLVALYDYITQSDPPKSLALRIDLSAYGPSAPETRSVTEPLGGDLGLNPASAEEKLTDNLCPPNINMEVDQTSDIDKPAREITEPPVLEKGEGYDLPASSLPSTVPIPDGPAQSDPITTVQGADGAETKAKGEAAVDVAMETDAPAHTVPAEVALQDHPVTMEAGEGGGSKKGTKRKRLQLDHGTKRRSARVRNTNKKKEDETINFHDLLQKFLPSSLMQVVEPEDEDADVQSAEEVDKQTDGQTDGQSQDEAPALTDCTPLTATEEADVREFLLKQQKNAGLVSIMKHYLHFLSKRDNRKWPDNVKWTYLEVYNRVRKHLKFPDCPDSEKPDPGTKANAKMCLVYMELKLDHWLSQKVKPVPSPGPPTGSPRKNSPVMSPVLGADFPGPHFKDDIWFLCAMIGYSQILEEFWAEHTIRVYWLRARFSILSNNMDDAMGWFDMTSSYLKYAAENQNLSEVLVYQCTVDNRISQDQVNKQLESLERCQSLEEIQKLYDDKQYQKVVDCLLQTFKQPQTKHQRRESDSIPERHAQLLLLQDSLFKLNDLQKCIFWGEEILNEALQHYRHAFGSFREEWGATLTQVFAGINKCVSKEAGIIGTLPNTSLVRLTHNLIHIIEMLMDTPDCITVVPVDTALPWILLYKLIKHEETKLHALSVGDGNDALEGAITSSFMLLNVAHEYLGRRSWCTNSDGLLLKFVMDVLREEMSVDRSKMSAVFREEINQAFEQCSLCLYGHPNKKSRVKHLQDHGCSQLPLTWEKAIDLFEYFKPKTVPEFDSYKTSTVSGELEGLLRRISTLVPDKYRAGNTVELVQSFIEGNSKSPPTAHAEKCAKVPVVRELYYLLADYYFKNKEQMKAIKFYLLDLCFNPERLDSWAGMALARMSRLEQKLNSHELKMEMPVLKQSIPSLRCFRRAVETDNTNSKLWIEYGCLAYELHSHASRQLKMKRWFPLAEDMLDLAKACRSDMLQIAQNCYKKANNCECDGNEEEWLHHYMMGKVAEKQGKHPQVYLQHYRQAAIYTHEDKAVYPRKITYVVSPPHLAVEALEVFYRLHASALKLLLKHSTEVDYKLIQQYLNEAAQSPFAQSKEKRRESRESLSSGSDVDQVSGQPGTPVRRRQSYPVTPQDHNYSRQKSQELGDKAILGTAPTTGTDSGALGTGKTCHDAVATSGDSDGISGGANSTSASESAESRPACDSGLPKSTITSEDLKSSDDKVADPKTTADNVTPKSGASDNLLSQSGSDSVRLVTQTQKPSTETVEKVQISAENVNIKSEALSVDALPDSVRDSVQPTVTPDKAPSFLMTDILGKASSEPVPGDTNPTTPAEVMQISGLPRHSSGGHAANLGNGSAPNQMQTDKTGKLSIYVDSSAVSQKLSDDSANHNSAVTQSNNKEYSEKNTDNSAVSQSGDLEVTPKVMETDEVFQMMDCSRFSSPQTPASTTTAPVPKLPLSPKTEPSSAPSDGKKVTEEPGNDLPVVDLITPDAKPDAKEAVSGAEARKEVEMECNESDSTPPGFDHPKHKQLMDQCISALSLCLSRFPQHYKSLYRLAHLYFKSPIHKNLQFSRDLLLGNPNWQQLEHMPAPGLFSDRKSTDFFKGVWRIPIDEIDRSGSFPSHLNRSIQLVLDVLREQKDASTLFLIHHQLSRVPDLGKKYLRDAERVWFAKQAFLYSLDSMEAKVTEMKTGADNSAQLSFILEVYRLWNYGINKMTAHLDRVNDLFALAFRTICEDKVDKNRPILEQALLFCQEQIVLARAQAPVLGSPRSQVQKSGFMSPSGERNQEFTHLFQADASRVTSPISQTVATSKPVTSPSVLAGKPVTSQSALTSKTSTSQSVIPSKPATNEMAITSKPGMSQSVMTNKPGNSSSVMVSKSTISQPATSSKLCIDRSGLTSNAGMGQPVSSKPLTNPSLTSTPETNQSVMTGIPGVSLHKPVFPVPCQPAAGTISARPSFSVLPKKTVLSSQPCVSSQLSGHSVSPSGPKPKAHPSEPAAKLNTGPLDLSVQSTSLSYATGKTTEHIPRPVEGQARPISVHHTHSMKPSGNPSDSLLTRLVNQPGQILSDVQQVIQQSVADPRPVMPTAESTCREPQSSSNTDVNTFLPPKPPIVSPPLSPSCILISDSESSLSSLLDYTIELNDSDFDEPIVIMSPDDDKQ
ncbi:calcineurin-binding protein cabin-1-like [Liolophura sinensis]|uniref:calcineurin-binding protein cabin-1-like n=1 Tax=Liolophura sinensis TaxID=3198878 RepID=UPI00315838A2